MSSDHSAFMDALSAFEDVFHRVESARAVPVMVAAYRGDADSASLSVCYTDLRHECYEATMDYEGLRRRRAQCEEVARRGDAAAPRRATMRWEEWFNGVVEGLAKESFSTSWKGPNEEGREEMCLTVFDTTFDLVAAPADESADRTAGLILGLLAAHRATRAHLAAARGDVVALEEKLTAEKARAASLRTALSSLNPEGVGIEAHANDPVGLVGESLTQTAAGAKRKQALSLVNPSKRVRRPRGTRIGAT